MGYSGKPDHYEAGLNAQSHFPIAADATYTSKPSDVQAEQKLNAAKKAYADSNKGSKYIVGGGTVSDDTAGTSPTILDRMTDHADLKKLNSAKDDYSSSTAKNSRKP